MREQSFRLCWALGRWDGIGIRFDESRHGLGIDVVRMGGFKQMAADGNRHVCRKSAGEGNTFTITGRMWKRFASSF